MYSNANGHQETKRRSRYTQLVRKEVFGKSNNAPGVWFHKHSPRSIPRIQTHKSRHTGGSVQFVLYRMVLRLRKICEKLAYRINSSACSIDFRWRWMAGKDEGGPSKVASK